MLLWLCHKPQQGATQSYMHPQSSMLCIEDQPQRGCCKGPPIIWNMGVPLGLVFYALHRRLGGPLVFYALHRRIEDWVAPWSSMLCIEDWVAL
jgi:hypothetical protein